MGIFNMKLESDFKLVSIDSRYNLEQPPPPTPYDDYALGVACNDTLWGHVLSPLPLSKVAERYKGAYWTDSDRASDFMSFEGSYYGVYSNAIFMFCFVKVL